MCVKADESLDMALHRLLQPIPSRQRWTFSTISMGGPADMESYIIFDSSSSYAKGMESPRSRGSILRVV